MHSTTTPSLSECTEWRVSTHIDFKVYIKPELVSKPPNARLLLTKSKDFVSILMTSGLCLCVCLFVCRHDHSRTEEATTNVKLHHVIQEGDD